MKNPLQKRTRQTYPAHGKKERHYFALRRQNIIKVAQGRDEQNLAKAKEILTIAIHNFVVKNLPEIIKQAVALPDDAKRSFEPVDTQL